MDANTLERLMMDQALGELSPDTAALLEAYLHDRPPDSQASLRIARTLREVKAALAGGAPARVRPFPAQVLAQKLRTQRRWALAGRLTSLAACVLIGIGVHAMWMLPAPAPRVAPGLDDGTTFAQAGSLAPVQEPSPSGDAGFWSVKRVYDRVSQRKTEAGRRVIWDSPLSTPRLGDPT